MNSKQVKLVYWVSTALFSFVIAGSIFLYLTQYERFSAGFLKLGYPSYLVYPLVGIKFLGLKKKLPVFKILPVLRDRKRSIN